MQELQSVLGQVISEICSSSLAVDAVELPPDAVMRGPVSIVGCVHVIGRTTGMVAIMCTDSLARRAAARMFDLTLETVTDADIRDAVGEFANVAAGNLKSVLADPHRLSMPSVVSGSDFQTQVLNGRTVAHGVFDSEAGMFAVSVYEEELASARTRTAPRVQ